MNQNKQDGEENSGKSLDYLGILRSRWKEIVAIFILIVSLTVVVTFLMPKSYMAATKFQIIQPQSLVQVGNEREVVEKLAATPNYVTMNISLISSPEVLKAVSSRLNLSAEFGLPDEDVANILKGMIKVEPEKMTDLVNVIVTGSDPKLVENIARTVPIAYEHDRTLRENTKVELAVKSLQEILKEQDEVVKEKQRKYLAAIEEHRYYIPSVALENRGTGVSMSYDMDEEEFRQAKASAQALDTKIKALESHQDEFNKLKDDQLLDYVVSADLMNSTEIGSASLRDLYRQYEEKNKEREELIAQNLLKNHPSMIAVTATQKLLRDKLDKTLISFKNTLSQNIGILKANHEALLEVAKEKEKVMTQRMAQAPKIEQLKREYDTSLEQFKEMDIKYKDQMARLRIPRVSIEIYGFPTLPTAPYKPNFMINLGIGCAAGLLLGCLVAFLLEMSDTSVRTMDEVEQALQVPVIGVVPKNIGSLFTTGDENSPDVEAYRIIRTNIEFNRGNKRELVITCVSSSAGEGKTTTVCNLSYVCAQAGYATLIVDGDLRRSKIHRYFSLDNDRGLSNYLVENASLEDVVFKTPVDNLYILPAGPTIFDPSGALNSPRFKELLLEVRQRFDMILIDSPPILGVSDSSLIVSESDMTIMVVQPRKMPVKALLRAKLVIESVKGKLVGAIMNNVTLTSDHQYQYYTTYYSYHKEDTPSVSFEPSAVAKSSKAQELLDKNDQTHNDLY